MCGRGAGRLPCTGCSRLDPAPHVGSVGRAADLGRRAFGAAFAPFLVGVPVMGRWPGFGTLFARGPEDTARRIDRHRVTARHPVTPTGEGDVGRHPARRTGSRAGRVGRVGLRAADGGGGTRTARPSGSGPTR